MTNLIEFIIASRGMYFEKYVCPVSETYRFDSKVSGTGGDRGNINGSWGMKRNKKRKVKILLFSLDTFALRLR